MKNLPDNPSIMTIDDVADFLKLSKITIYKLVKKGDIPGFRVGNSWRFQRDKIELLAAHAVPPEKKTS
jgi:excisionase family DNA binding protein